MNARKIDRALYGPSLFEVTLGALLSLALGVALAFCLLVLKPVEVVKELPKEEERQAGTVYFVEGAKDPARSKGWMRKRQMLIDGAPGEVALSEEELNAWFSSGAPAKVEKRPVPKAAPGAKGQPEPAEEPTEVLTLDVPNVRIRDSVFQVGIPGNLNLLTLTLPVVVQTQGTFAKGSEMWEFKPSTMYLGSMPLHRIPGFTDMLMKKLMHSNVVPEDAMATWKRVSDVSLDGKTLKLTIAPTATPAG
jgi:hypothetical protein